MSPLRIRKESSNGRPKREYDDMEFLTEHLGYPPVNLLDALYNAHLVTLYQAIESLQEYAEAIPDLAPRTIDAAMQRLENKVDQILDDSFDIFQKYFYDHILRIPSKLNIPLEHHKDLDLDCNEEQESLLDKELAEAVKAVQQQKAFNNVLKQKLEILEEDKQIVQKYSETLEVLKIPKERNIYPINDVVKFLHDQHEVLRERILVMIRQVAQEGALDKIQGPDERLKILHQSAEKMLETFRRAEERKEDVM